MKAILITLLNVLPILTIAILLLGHAEPVQAMPCFTNLANCYQQAATVDSFWMRWAAGLDCELNFISCVREDIVGY